MIYVMITDCKTIIMAYILLQYHAIRHLLSQINTRYVLPVATISEYVLTCNDTRPTDTYPVLWSFPSNFMD